MDPIAAKLISELRTTQDEIAKAAMEFPKSEPFEHGVQVGKHQGLRIALEAIDYILRDQQAKEQS